MTAGIGPYVGEDIRVVDVEEKSRKHNWLAPGSERTFATNCSIPTCEVRW
jgi:hypothetical protein